jgi:hypothetical protein
MIASRGKTGLPPSSAWRTYRAWRLVAWGGFLLFFLLPFRKLVPGTVFSVAEWTWLGVWMFALGHVGSFRCPRCGKFFHTRLTPPPIGHSNPLSRKCLNCGLPRGMDP